VRKDRRSQKVWRRACSLGARRRPLKLEGAAVVSISSLPRADAALSAPPLRLRASHELFDTLAMDDIEARRVIDADARIRLAMQACRALKSGLLWIVLNGRLPSVVSDTRSRAVASV
jgi:hypothetical protein